MGTGLSYSLGGGGRVPFRVRALPQEDGGGYLVEGPAPIPGDAKAALATAY